MLRPPIFRRRGNPFRPSLSFFAIGIFLYLSWHNLTTPFSLIPSRTAKLELHRTLNATTKVLRFLIEEPYEDSDFVTMGDRVAAFSAVGQLLLEDPSYDRQEFLSLLQEQFPWVDIALIPTPWTPDVQSLKGPAAGSKTGIVVTAGRKNFILAAHLIYSLRYVLNSTLPILIGYSGDLDLSPSDREGLTSIGPDITTVDLIHIYDDSVARLRYGKWAQKPFAALAAPFEQVILVDADVVFLQSPDNLLSTHPGFLDTGTLFYHDRVYTDHNSRRDWFLEVAMQGREPSETLKRTLHYREDLFENMESGMVGFDKTRPGVFMALLFATWMNTGKVRTEVTYVHTLGDKESYWMACELSGCPYYFQPEYAGAIGKLDPETYQAMIRGTVRKQDGEIRRPELCSTHMVHPDQGGQNPLWINGGIYDNKMDGHYELAKFTHWLDPGATHSDAHVGKNFTEDKVWRFDGYIACLNEGVVHSVEGTELGTILGNIREGGKIINAVLYNETMDEDQERAPWWDEVDMSRNSNG